MCGIVGYYGPLDPKDVIVKGLKCLEYRGYDSAGVAILDNGQFRRVRAEGKLINLENKLKTEKFKGHLGIGHTRWATHGSPTERNAHPHFAKGIGIVHNGIIENYEDLKDELRKKGAKFESETDTELIAHLIAEYVSEGQTFFDAVLTAARRLTGAYSVLVVAEGHPEEMIAFKSGPPLILGLGTDSCIIASDISAIIAYTQKVIHLEDDELVHVTGKNAKLFNLDGKAIFREPTVVQWSADQVEKQGYRHFMLKEIFEQPRAVAQAIEPHIDVTNHELHFKNFTFTGSSSPVDLLADIERVFFVACGTSNYAGMVGEYLVEKMARVPVETDIASEFRYRNPVIPPKSLVVVVSQSGETADTLAALRLANESGALTLSICNVKNSSIDRESTGHLYMNAGPEIGVASTKAFVSTLAVLHILALGLAKAKDRLSKDDERKIVKSLLAAPSLMETVLSFDKFFAQAANTLKNSRGFLYMGRGVSYPIALEGALKMKELAYKHAEGYAAGEMKHGPLALIDKSMLVVMLVPKDELYEKTVSNLEQVRAREGTVISISTLENKKLRDLSEHYLSLPEAPWNINPLLEVIPLQLLSYHVADALGLDVDQPRNLAKSVTVE